MAHFGTKSQPYAAEAKEWLTKFVQGRKVCIQLHRIDQYGRAVSTVWVHRRRWPWLWWPVWWNVSLEMVRAGFATIYRDTGAEYGGILKDLETSEARAKKCKTGMWAQSHTEYQSPGDFKRMNRLQAALRNSEDQQQKTSRIDFISESQKNTRLKSAWQ
jgi:endonuclease YncB( thermonuclease family)